MKNEMIPRDKRFMLRRTLFPWKMEDTVLEAVRYCTDFDVDEIIWKIDTEEFSHGLPELDRIRAYLPWLDQSRHMLFAIGVTMSINPWVTQGMRDAGLNNRKAHPDFEWMTDVTGTQANAIACPRSPGWRKWMKDAYALYASTRPRVLWIEDDIRIHGHRPVAWACFCERHLHEFGQYFGRTFTREELVAEVLKPGAPSPVRTAWLAFEGEGIRSILQEVAASVHAVSPETHVGLMCSAPWSHAMEIRDWDETLDAVRGSHPFVTIRPCMGNYQESNARGIYDSWQFVAGTLACVRQPVHACTEIENWPFTRFAKSVRFTRAQVLLSAALRCPSMTFNMYDHVGTSLYEEPQYGVMLKDVRARADALADIYQSEGVDRGIGILQPEDGGAHKRLDAGAKYGDLSMGREHWAMRLQALGFSMTYEHSEVVAVSGKRLEAYAANLDGIFSRGVLLDLSALECLLAMGREDLVGVKLAETFQRRDRATPAEEPVDAEFGGAGGSYMSVDHLGLAARVGRIQPGPKARVISRLVNPDREPVQPGFVLSENVHGGRIALCPYEIGYGDSPWFLNWHRRRQFNGILRWLFRGRLPLSVDAGAYPLPMRTDCGGTTYVSVMNLSLDDWHSTSIRVNDIDNRRRAAILRPGGTWHPHGDVDTEEDGGLTLRFRDLIQPLDMITVRLD